MKLLVLGTGGREHALAWRLSQDSDVSEVFLHPGNPGTLHAGFANLGEVSIDAPGDLVKAARERSVDLVVIGPEVLLAKGYGDLFRKEGFLVVGPGKNGAQLETSKAFAKSFLDSACIPTASYCSVESEIALREKAKHLPIVLKLDGLAAGKGVVVATEFSHVEDFISRVWKENEFGPGPHKVVVEDFIEGSELSYIGLCDGNRFIPLSSASDYKRLNDGDQGPNTGGMGAISPSPILTQELEARIEQRIVAPTLKELSRKGIEYRGVLYFGLMITKTGDPFVLEFNARFGDPETQALMLRIEDGLAELLQLTAKGLLGQAPVPHWKPGSAVYIVAASEGYPSRPRSGDLIEGIENFPNHATLFFSGVQTITAGLATSGGRVLGVGAIGRDPQDCREKAYSALSTVRWKGIHFRRDIGLKGAPV